MLCYSTSQPAASQLNSMRSRSGSKAGGEVLTSTLKSVSKGGCSINSLCSSYLTGPPTAWADAMLQAYMSCTSIDQNGQVGLLCRYTALAAMEGRSPRKTKSISTAGRIHSRKFAHTSIQPSSLSASGSVFSLQYRLTFKCLRDDSVAFP